MSARVTDDGMVYSDELGRAVVRFSQPFSEMDADEREATRKRLLDMISQAERKLTDLRSAYEKSAEASRRASDKTQSAYRAVNSRETELAVLSDALRDSLVSGDVK